MSGEQLHMGALRSFIWELYVRAPRRRTEQQKVTTHSVTLRRSNWYSQSRASLSPFLGLAPAKQRQDPSHVSKGVGRKPRASKGARAQARWFGLLSGCRNKAKIAMFRSRNRKGGLCINRKGQSLSREESIARREHREKRA